MSMFGILCGLVGDGVLIYFSLRWMKLRQRRSEDRRDNLARRLGAT